MQHTPGLSSYLGPRAPQPAESGPRAGNSCGLSTGAPVAPGHRQGARAPARLTPDTGRAREHNSVWRTRNSLRRTHVDNGRPEVSLETQDCTQTQDCMWIACTLRAAQARQPRVRVSQGHLRLQHGVVGVTSARSPVFSNVEKYQGWPDPMKLRGPGFGSRLRGDGGGRPGFGSRLRGDGGGR